MYSIKRICLLLLLLCGINSVGNSQTWIGTIGGANNWSNALNWSPNSVPGAGATVTFNSGSNLDCNLPTGVLNVNTITVNGYTGTITQSTGNLFVNNFTLTTGTFIGSANNIIINSGGILTINGGAFTASSGNLTFLASAGTTTLNFSSGTFNASTGTVYIDATAASHVSINNSVPLNF